MNILYSGSVKKQLAKIPKRELKKIFLKIERLSLDPQAGKYLKGEFEGLLSLRAWPYRIIYKFNSREIVIYSISHRQGVYK